MELGEDQYNNNNDVNLSSPSLTSQLLQKSQVLVLTDMDWHTTTNSVWAGSYRQSISCESFRKHQVLGCIQVSFKLPEKTGQGSAATTKTKNSWELERETKDIVLTYKSISSPLYSLGCLLINYIKTKYTRRKPNRYRKALIWGKIK